MKNLSGKEYVLELEAEDYRSIQRKIVRVGNTQGHESLLYRMAKSGLPPCVKCCANQINYCSDNLIASYACKMFVYFTSAPNSDIDRARKTNALDNFQGYKILKTLIFKIEKEVIYAKISGQEVWVNLKKEIERDG